MASVEGLGLYIYYGRKELVSCSVSFSTSRPTDPLRFALHLELWLM